MNYFLESTYLLESFILNPSIQLRSLKLQYAAKHLAWHSIGIWWPFRVCLRKEDVGPKPSVIHYIWAGLKIRPWGSNKTLSRLEKKTQISFCHVGCEMCRNSPHTVNRQTRSQTLIHIYTSEHKILNREPACCANITCQNRYSAGWFCYCTFIVLYFSFNFYTVVQPYFDTDTHKSCFEIYNRHY